MYLITKCRTSLRAGCFTSHIDVSPHECWFGVTATCRHTFLTSLFWSKLFVFIFPLGTVLLIRSSRVKVWQATGFFIDGVMEETASEFIGHGVISFSFHGPRFCRHDIFL